MIKLFFGGDKDPVSTKKDLRGKKPLSITTVLPYLNYYILTFDCVILLSPLKCLQCVTQKQKQNQQKQHNSFFVYPQTIEIRLTDGCDDSSNELISAMRLWRRHRPPKTISRRFDDDERRNKKVDRNRNSSLK